MSRKKSQKSKGSNPPAPSAIPTPKEDGKVASDSHPNGTVMSGRPSLSNSGEFYDIAFKVMLVGDSGVGKTCLLVRFKDGAFLAGSFISTVGIDFRSLILGPSGALPLKNGTSRNILSPVPPVEEEDVFGSSALLPGKDQERRHYVWRKETEERGQEDEKSKKIRSGSANKVLNVDGIKVKLQIWDTAGQERFRSVTHAYYRDAHALLLLYDITNKTSFDNIQAWLTEIHEYAQKDVVIMLLGNKVDSTHERVVKIEDGERLAKEYGVPFMETSAKSGLNVELAFTAIAKELKHRSMKLPNEPKFKLHDYVKKEVKGSGCCKS